MKKNDVKALGWFVHAGANGYIESKVLLIKYSITQHKCF